MIVGTVLADGRTGVGLTPAGEVWLTIYNLAAPLFGDEKAQEMAFAAADHARGDVTAETEALAG